MKISKYKDRYRTQIATPDGKHKAVYGKTKKEVRLKVNDLIAEIENGEWIAKDNTTVGAWFKEWVDVYLVNLKPSTVKTYQMHVKNHIIPHFGNRKLQSLEHAEVQKFINLKSEKLSAKTVKNIHLVLHKGLSDALKNRLIKHNPADNISLPKVKKREMLTIPEDKIGLFIDTAYSMSEYGDMLEFALQTGLRESELIGLTFDRYDSKTGKLTIDRQIYFNTDEFILPKHDVIREISLNEKCREIIENRKVYGKKDTDFIFSTVDGRHVPHQTLYGHFKRIAQIIGIPELRIHDLRHTYATLAHKSGMLPKTLQMNLGHATVAFTLQMYVHDTEDMQKKSSDNLGNLFENLKNS